MQEQKRARGLRENQLICFAIKQKIETSFKIQKLKKPRGEKKERRKKFTAIKCTSNKKWSYSGFPGNSKKNH